MIIGSNQGGDQLTWQLLRIWFSNVLRNKSIFICSYLYVFLPRTFCMFAEDKLLTSSNCKNEIVILDFYVKFEFGSEPNHLRVWIQHTSAVLHTQLLRTAGRWVGTVWDPITSKTSWELGSKLLMDQPASYMKIIPQLILMGEGEKQCHDPCSVQTVGHKYTASRNHSYVCVPFKEICTTEIRDILIFYIRTRYWLYKLCVHKLSVRYYSSACPRLPCSAIDQDSFMHVKEVRMHRCTSEDIIRKFLIEIKCDGLKCKTKYCSEFNE
jgi:hypothetical protein